jgi:hypothetical protein
MEKPTKLQIATLVICGLTFLVMAFNAGMMYALSIFNGG